MVIKVDFYPLLKGPGEREYLEKEWNESGGGVELLFFFALFLFKACHKPYLTERGTFTLFSSTLTATIMN